MGKYGREVDVSLAIQMQHSLQYILSCFIEVVRKACNKAAISSRRRVGHSAILLEQILRGCPPKHVERLWRHKLGRTEELTMENLVKFLESDYPLVRDEWATFQQCAQQIMERHRGLAIKVAKHVSKQIYHVSFEDFLGEAYLALIGAALRYKQHFKTNFSTYAYYVIKSWLISYASHSLPGISLPPTAYTGLKKNNQCLYVYHSSQLKDEDAEIPVDVIEEENSYEAVLPSNHVTDGLEYAEMRDVVNKLPPLFKAIGLLVLQGDVVTPGQLSKLTGISQDVCLELFRLLKTILEVLM